MISIPKNINGLWSDKLIGITPAQVLHEDRLAATNKKQQLIELELNNIPDGLYFVNIRSEEKNATIKIVKKK